MAEELKQRSMSDKLLIDRKLLERLQERLDPHIDARDWGMLCDAFRAQQSSQGGEAVNVVGIRISTDGFGSYIADSTMGIGPAFPGEVREPLMTVAQHNRIMAAATPADSRVVPVELLKSWVTGLQCGIISQRRVLEDLRELLEVKP